MMAYFGEVRIGSAVCAPFFEVGVVELHGLGAKDTHQVEYIFLVTPRN